LLTSIKMQRHERFLKQEKREGIKDSWKQSFHMLVTKQVKVSQILETSVSYNRTHRRRTHETILDKNLRYSLLPQ
jgi:hypothetical protein